MSSSLFSSSSPSAFFSSGRDTPLMNRDVTPIGVGSSLSPSYSFSIQGDSLEIKSSLMTTLKSLPSPLSWLLLPFYLDFQRPKG